ncbi:ORF42 [Felid gammaherpesvirus 1]|uniref:ORF42 n=1 Tax=Felid gammaherpesvirus 1 TaxID=2560468 RepID=A0A0M4MPW0_9GAMA|nr:ORF42 [Felis catus gammaherpesvirus 1]ALE14753.1 ORF42 [Felis catus gammaherpesvirus 1]
MDSVIRTIVGSKKDSLYQDMEYMFTFALPRMVLEVNRSNNVCIASNSETFFQKEELDVAALAKYVRQKTISPTYRGFIMTCLLETEDMVEKINLYPHVFKERVFIYTPVHNSAIELCVLISILENFTSPTLVSILSILQRARFIYTKYKSKDTAFLLNGIEALAATTINYFELANNDDHTTQPGLLLYKLHKAIEGGSVESKGLLKPIFLYSFKMDGKENTLNSQSICQSFNIFYSETIFTHHFRCPQVVSIYKDKCLEDKPRVQIFS